jgi:hypothetical protein
LEQGVDIRVVQEVLGHSTLAMTKKYTHVTSRLAKEAAARMSLALWDTDDDGSDLDEDDQYDEDTKNRGLSKRN